jgi:antibiotic biosynthesis monooxygenase (ABM) superfamily enzyme
MQKSVWLVVFLVILGIGFAAGFYLSNYFQNQIQVLVGAAIVIAVLTWMGSGTDILGLLRDWFREQREEERTLC